MKIVVIGAGSADFGTGNLAALMQCQKLKGSELFLVDINAEHLVLIEKLAKRYNTEWDTGIQINATTDRRKALPGANIVVVSIAVDREERWRLDFESTIPLGLRQPYAENGGPGGMAHSFRNIPMVYAIAKDMEQFCPDAWMLSYTNPVPRIIRAITHYTSIKAVGLCPGFYILQSQIAQILNRDPKHFEVIGAGLNHFGWVLDIRDTTTGEDLYPLFRESAKKADSQWLPLSRTLLELTGYFPYPSDDHVAEYLNLCHHPERRPWERWGLHQFSYEAHASGRDSLWKRIREVVEEGKPLSHIGESVELEMTTPLVRSLGFGEKIFMPALNIPNKGYITNLPEDAIVEVPALADGKGIHGIVIGDLPNPIAGWCSIQTFICNLVAEAGVTGSKEIALQALLLDPMVNDINQAKEIIEVYLKVHADYLPQFIQK